MNHIVVHVLAIQILIGTPAFAQAPAVPAEHSTERGQDTSAMSPEERLQWINSRIRYLEARRAAEKTEQQTGADKSLDDGQSQSIEAQTGSAQRSDANEKRPRTRLVKVKPKGLSPAAQAMFSAAAAQMIADRLMKADELASQTPPNSPSIDRNDPLTRPIGLFGRMYMNAAGLSEAEYRAEQKRSSDKARERKEKRAASPYLSSIDAVISDMHASRKGTRLKNLYYAEDRLDEQSRIANAAQLPSLNTPTWYLGVGPDFTNLVWYAHWGLSFVSGEERNKDPFFSKYFSRPIKQTALGKVHPEFIRHGYLIDLPQNKAGKRYGIIRYAIHKNTGIVLSPAISLVNDLKIPEYVSSDTYFRDLDAIKEELEDRRESAARKAQRQLASDQAKADGSRNGRFGKTELATLAVGAVAVLGLVGWAALSMDDAGSNSSAPAAGNKQVPVYFVNEDGTKTKLAFDIITLSVEYPDGTIHKQNVPSKGGGMITVPAGAKSIKIRHPFKQDVKHSFPETYRTDLPIRIES